MHGPVPWWVVQGRYSWGQWAGLVVVAVLVGVMLVKLVGLVGGAGGAGGWEARRVPYQ